MSENLTEAQLRAVERWCCSHPGVENWYDIRECDMPRFVAALLAASRPAPEATPESAEPVAWVRKHPDTGELSGEWVSVADRLPESGKTVLATYQNRLGKLRRIRAQYIAPKTREKNADFDELEGEYDEATDTYYWCAGWYECIDNWSDYSHVAVCEGDVTHWMPMPDAPILAAKGDGQ